MKKESLSSIWEATERKTYKQIQKESKKFETQTNQLFIAKINLDAECNMLYQKLDYLNKLDL